MDQDPLEQQKAKIDAVREETSKNLGRLFDEKDKLSKRVADFIARLEIYERGGLVFNKEEIIEGVRRGVEIQDKEKFIAHLLKVLEPYIVLRVTQSKIFNAIEEKASREQIIKNPDNLPLSEVLYASFEGERVDIHLTPAKDFMTKEKIEDFKQEIKRGLIKLAEMIKSYPSVKEIWASSWIVATSPKRLEELGFVVVGPISEEERREHFEGEKRPISKAFMKREDFLARYGSSK